MPPNPAPVRTISATVARRLAVTKQRLAGSPPATVGSDELLDVARSIRCLQLDPISVVARSHLLVLWSRVGVFDRSALDTLLWQDRSLFEYWAHAASIVLTEDYQLHQGRMRTFPAGKTAWSRRTKEWLEQNAALRRRILVELRRRGPLPSRAFEGSMALERWASSGWTSGHDVTQMLDLMMTQGRIMVAGRDGQGRLWDLAERCLPRWTPRTRLSAPEIDRRAVQLAIRALGAPTLKDVRQHFLRNWYDDLRGDLTYLERRGLIHRVRVSADGEGTPADGWVHALDIDLLDRLEAGDGWEPRTTLLSPFDNMICDRDRARRLFRFDYTIEIYVPKSRRRFGYYAMPILHGDRLIGRLDPKFDRKSGRLTILSTHAEEDAPLDAATGRAIRRSVEDLALFLGATDIAWERPVPDGWHPLLRG